MNRDNLAEHKESIQYTLLRRREFLSFEQVSDYIADISSQGFKQSEVDFIDIDPNTLNVNEDDLLQAFDIVEEVLAIFPRLDKLERLKAPQAHLDDKFDKKKAQTEAKTLEHKK